jgi:hypothetical protein
MERLGSGETGIKNGCLKRENSLKVYSAGSKRARG